MKIRQNFVSNSSSTSFILKYDTKDFVKCEHCGHQPLTPLELAQLEDDEYLSGEGTEIKFVGFDQYIEYLEEKIEEYRRYNEMDTYYTKLLNNAVKMKLTPTEEILCADVSYGSRLEEEISNMKERGIITLLDENIREE